MFKYISIVMDFLVLIYPLSVILGIILVCLYAIANAVSSSRYFSHYPRIVRNMIFGLINISNEWGPRFILFFILASLALQLISFLMQ